MLQSIRKSVRGNLFLRKVIGYHLASSGLFDRYFRNYKVDDVWERRISDVLQCADNQYIPRDEKAGLIKNGIQWMHNGIRIRLGSYYGPEYARMLLLNRGVHEPQEERVFMEALRTIPKGAVMIEMGAFWSFYSMWFQKEIPGAVNFMIEPDAFNLGQGKRNFELNKMRGEFIQAFVGKDAWQEGDKAQVSVDKLVQDKKLPFIHMLHSDIQGFEYDMLQGAVQSFAEKKIGYVFISTHSNLLHKQCLSFLTERGFIILASADINESYSEDGLIAARAPYFDGISPVDIAKRGQ